MASENLHRTVIAMMGLVAVMLVVTVVLGLSSDLFFHLPWARQFSDSQSLAMPFGMTLKRTILILNVSAAVLSGFIASLFVYSTFVLFRKVPSRRPAKVALWLLLWGGLTAPFLMLGGMTSAYMAFAVAVLFSRVRWRVGRKWDAADEAAFT